MNKTIRRAAIITALGIVSLAAVFASVAVGTVKFTAGEILRAIFIDDDSAARLLIFHLRLPRVLTGALVGISLSLSGCILQGVMRNTLASPSTVGVTSGASLAGYLTLAAFPSLSQLLPVGSMLGAFAATMAIWALAYRNGVSPVRMILSGMAVSAMLGACTDLIRTAFAERIGSVSGFLVGGLNGSSWETFFTVLPYAAAGCVCCLLLPVKMNLLMLGDETAGSLGLHTERFRFFLILLSSLLAGSAISAAGLISFVGLIVPHIARLLVGSDYRYLFPASILLGASLVTLCDTLGRVILPPGEVPVSILLSFIGAPFFLWLLHQKSEGT